VGAELLAFCRRAADVPEARWGALAAAPVLWFAIAWGDVRVLALVPLVAAPFAVVHERRRRRGDDGADDPDDWF
jgi:hypothetical protein